MQHFNDFTHLNFYFCWIKASKSLKEHLFSSLLFFFSLRENILKTAKALVEDTKMLVSGAASGQDKLSQAAQSSAKTITQLTDVVKLGAASIGSDDPETQVSQLCFYPSILFSNYCVYYQKC